MERKFSINWSLLVEEAKQRRKQLNITQQRLAMLAGVSTPTISHFENGEKDVQLSSILSILGVLGMIDRHKLEFPNPKPVYLFDGEVIRFYGQDGIKQVQCAISVEALEDHFKTDEKDKLQIFKANQVEIEYEARRKYLTNRLEADGSVFIESKDL